MIERARRVVRRQNVVGQMEPLPTSFEDPLGGFYVFGHDDTEVVPRLLHVPDGGIDVVEIPLPQHMLDQGDVPKGGAVVDTAVILLGDTASTLSVESGEEGAIWRSTVVPPVSSSDWELVLDEVTVKNARTNGDQTVVAPGLRRVGASVLEGVWRSTDGGATWGHVEVPGIGTARVEFCPHDGRFVACADFVDQLRVSDDDGLTWQTVGGLSGYSGVQGLGSARGSTAWLLNTSSGILKSDDDGASWSSVDSGPDFRYSSPSVGTSSMGVMVARGGSGDSIYFTPRPWAVDAGDYGNGREVRVALMDNMDVWEYEQANTHLLPLINPSNTSLEDYSGRGVVTTGGRYVFTAVRDYVLYSDAAGTMWTPMSMQHPGLDLAHHAGVDSVFSYGESVE